MSLTYQELMHELAGLAASKASGTLFVRSDCNHAISITLMSGQITALYFGPRKGIRVIEQIRGISGGSCHFDRDAPQRATQQLPANAEIFRLLQSDLEIPVASSQSPGPGEQPADSGEWNASLDQLRDLLTDHLGPIAAILYDEALDEVGGSCTGRDGFLRLANKLAVNIDAASVRPFEKRVATILEQAPGA